MRDEGRAGTLQAFAAYGIWGLFPLYFHALAPAGAWEVLAHRILGTLLFCTLILLLQRDLGWIRPLLAARRMALAVSVAALLIAANWGLYSAAVLAGRTNEAALGYFLNPLVTIALGVVVLRERLRPLQWLAITIGAVASGYLILAGGEVPVLALVLAVTFALYSLIKKRVGVTMPPMHSLAAETAVIVPVALGILVWVTATGSATFTTEGPVHVSLLVVSGVVTAVPLLLFAGAARRIPLVTIGLIQFLTPVMQLIMSVTVLGEHMPRERWIGFGIVWLALLVLSVDSVAWARTHRRVRSAEVTPA